MTDRVNEPKSANEVASPEVRALESRIRELERVLGKMTLENEILWEVLKIVREKELIPHVPLSSEGRTS